MSWMAGRNCIDSRYEFDGGQDGGQELDDGQELDGGDDGGMAGRSWMAAEWRAKWRDGGRSWKASWIAG